MGNHVIHIGRLAQFACALAVISILSVPSNAKAQATSTSSPIEYKIYQTPLYTMEKKLNELAGEGWRLHSTMPLPAGRPCKFDNEQDAKDCSLLILERRQTKAGTR